MAVPPKKPVKPGAKKPGFVPFAKKGAKPPVVPPKKTPKGK